MSKELSKTYDPKDIEDRLYKKWEDNGYFHAEVDRSKKPFTIVMPPPNITGQLHMGHALDNTMQDILIRYKRMQGYNALWQPGTDHASIATEVKVIQSLKEQGINKADLTREEFLDKCWEWRKEYGGRIVKQLRKLGSSADWQRERFTMDEGCSHAVQEVFTKLYKKGWIYKGSRIVNWCPVCKTSISDAEVEHEEQDGFFWHINYPVVGEEGRFVEIATTRPETLFGDTAVAVNPDDERYKDIVGKTLKLPMTDREIPVIADAYVDKEFGTGCVKITPAHDPNDFEVGKRHNLEEIVVINDDATMNEKAGKYAGMDRYECRKALVDDLKKEGLLVKVVPHSHNVGVHDRCHTTVEPMIKQQWFVKMDEMIKPAVEGVKNGDIKLLPKRMDKTYFNWTDNIRDWCISRQLWWGHRIPAWYCDDCGEMVVSIENPGKCPKCGCTHMTQDPDTLDTWFSSALWPFSTLGWPEKTEDLDYFYPNDVLVTGYDIIFFWVIRMIFSGYEQMGKAPFHTVLFHGLVRDSQGRKMSKSLGNGIDPLEVIDKYGADALRLTLITGNAPGNEDPVSANAALWTLKTVLTEALKLLHPYMPFITEEIFCTLQSEEETIMLSKWPEYKEEWNFPAEEAAIEHCKDLVKGIRNVRTEMDVPPSRKAKLYITSEDAGLRTVFEENKEVYVNLASTSEIIVQADKNGISEDAVSVVIPGAVLYLPLEDLVDFEKEKERLHKEKDKLTKELARSKGMLSNEKFLNNAKPEKVQEEKDKLAKYEQMMAQVEARLAQMK